MGCLGATEGHTHAPAPPISTASGLNLEAGAGGTSTGGSKRICCTCNALVWLTVSVIKNIVSFRVKVKWQKNLKR
mgnify:CR=1 FL=1